jgi:hypothetical protein
MKNIEAKLEYQKETGHGLEWLRETVDPLCFESECQCPECGNIWNKSIDIDLDLKDYINWLEEKLCSILSQQSHAS